jgi:predicted permease
VRQFVTESLLLASLGGIGGLVVARWLVGYLATALDQSRMVDLAVPLDGRAVAVTLAVVGGSAVLFGLLPAVRGTRADVVREIRETGRGQTGHGRRFGVSAALVSLQVALSLMLVTGAALFVGSVRNLERVDAGFDPSNVVIFRLDPTLNGYEGERLRALYATLLDRLRALPAVVGATVSSHTLISGSAAISEVFGGDGGPHEPTAGHGASQGTGPARRRTLAWCLNIDDEFFRTMGMRVLRGRTFGPGDAPASQPVAVVNSTFARAVFEGDAPLGRRFRLSDRPGAPEYEVVGVVADARFSSIRADPPATVYLSYRQQDPGAMTVAVKSARSPLEILPAVRAAVADIDANVPLFDVRTQAAQIAESLRQERLFAQLASALGAVTLLLAAVGLYGLLAGSVVSRIPEIGLRMALGADRRAVRWMVLRHSLVLVAIGVACGIPASLAGMRVVDSVLFGLTDVEVWVIAAATATLAAVSAIAAYLPARRASRIDPIAALRA